MEDSEPLDAKSIRTLAIASQQQEIDRLKKLAAEGEDVRADLCLAAMAFETLSGRDSGSILAFAMGLEDDADQIAKRQ